MRILITGGAGFVGASLARQFKAARASDEVVAFDNLKRRGSELNLPLLKQAGVAFVHGDIRSPHDFDALEGKFDLLIEASAEPSVLSGAGGKHHYLLDTNLVGTLNCLDYASRACGALIFLSTSRVYGIDPLRALPLVEAGERLVLDPRAKLPAGCTAAGITEEFSTASPRSLYGTTKLASELLVEEFAAAYGIRTFINRCGVICGPGQFGKADQGVFTLWVANHYFGKPLRYTGFGGTGRQVRDLLHPRDLFALITKQIAELGTPGPRVFNVGGSEQSVSLLELTGLCRQATGREIPIGSDPTSNPVDIPWYVTDNAKVQARFDWKPKTTVAQIVGEIAGWLKQDEASLKSIFAG